MSAFKGDLVEKRRFLRKENQRYGLALTRVPEAAWRQSSALRTSSAPVLSVWRSCRYLVTIFEEKPRIHRISICRSALDDQGRWKDDIPWEELQRLKDEAGYSQCDAVEIYPAAADLVNVANMRHLWVCLDQPRHPLTWRGP